MEWDRIQYGADLVKFSNLVSKYDNEQVFKNLYSELYKTSSEVTRAQGNIIKVDVKGIEIILKKRMSGSIPSDLQSITIYLDSCSEFDTSIDINIKDRILKSYNFQIEVKGINDDGEHYNAWHLDKDIRSAKPNNSKVSHPLYHFQAGGNNLENRRLSGAVFLSAPRLPHPPMDVILGLHFILKNFCSTKDYKFLEKIFSDCEYEDLIERAKNRMFKPYFRAFELNNTHQDFTVENVFPMAF